MPLGSDDIRELAPFIPEGLPPGLANYWYPVLPISALPVDKVVGLTLLGEPGGLAQPRRQALRPSATAARIAA